MFEKEIIVNSLKKSRGLLEKLIEDMERNPNFEAQEVQYCSQELKRIEVFIRKVRRIEEQLLSDTGMRYLSCPR